MYTWARDRKKISVKEKTWKFSAKLKFHPFLPKIKRILKIFSILIYNDHAINALVLKYIYLIYWRSYEFIKNILHYTLIKTDSKSDTPLKLEVVKEPLKYKNARLISIEFHYCPENLKMKWTIMTSRISLNNFWSICT